MTSKRYFSFAFVASTYRKICSLSIQLYRVKISAKSNETTACVAKEEIVARSNRKNDGKSKQRFGKKNAESLSKSSKLNW